VVIAEDARRADDQVEASPETKTLDQSLVRGDSREPASKMRQHPGMRVHSYQIDAFAVERRRQPAGADPEIENRTIGLPAPVEPRPEVGGVGKRGVQLGEARVRPARIVPDRLPFQGTRLISLSGT
jgi:hypothetical protein